MMIKRHLFLLWMILTSFPFVYADKIDPSISSYEVKERVKYRVDVFDFEGDYPNLENIDIDARRKKRVELLLPGEYPLLEKINYEGTFGSLIGKLTGSFPKLSTVNFLCSSAAMQLDLTGKWCQDCEINIRGTTGNIVITLPKENGVIVHTKTSSTGKVVNNGLRKKGWGWLNKTFMNEQHGNDKDIQLVVNIEVTKAKIILNLEPSVLVNK